jgi:hypothetical protein
MTTKKTIAKPQAHAYRIECMNPAFQGLTANELRSIVAEFVNATSGLRKADLCEMLDEIDDKDFQQAVAMANELRQDKGLPKVSLAIARASRKGAAAKSVRPAAKPAASKRSASRKASQRSASASKKKKTTSVGRKRRSPVRKSPGRRKSPVHCVGPLRKAKKGVLLDQLKAYDNYPAKFDDEDEKNFTREEICNWLKKAKKGQTSQRSAKGTFAPTQAKKTAKQRASASSKRTKLIAEDEGEDDDDDDDDDEEEYEEQYEEVQSTKRPRRGGKRV